MSWGTPTSLNTAVQSSATTHSLTMSSVTVAQNSLIIVTGAMLAHANGDTIVVSDSAGNTYTVFQHYKSAAVNCSYIAWAVASTALSAGTITVADTSTGATNFTSCAFAAFSVTGAGTSSVEDTAAEGSNDAASTTSPTVTSGTPGTAGDLFFAVYETANNNGNTYTEDASWTNAANKIGNAALSCSSAYLTNAGTGTKTHAPTTASLGYSQVVTAFKLAPATSNHNGLLLMGCG